MKYEVTFTLNDGSIIGPLLISKEVVDRLNAGSLPRMIVLSNDKDEEVKVIIKDLIKVIGLHEYDFDEEKGIFSDTFYEYTAVAEEVTSASGNNET